MTAERADTSERSKSTWRNAPHQQLVQLSLWSPTGEPVDSADAEWLGELVHQLPLAVVLADASGIIRFVNRSSEAMFQFSADELLAQPLERLVPQTRDLFGEFLSGLTASSTTLTAFRNLVESVVLRRDGTEFPVAIMAVPIRVGESYFAALCMQDLTAQKAAEAQLHSKHAQFLQAQKMETIGRLASGIAHDFNNLLTAILGYAELVTSDLDPAIPVYQEVEEIQRTAQRAVGLVRQLLAFSRPPLAEPQSVDINACLKEIERLLRRVVGEDIELVSRLEPALACISADPAHVSQVLLNLVVNARDAMPVGGKIFLHTGNVGLAPVDIDALGLCVLPGRYVYLKVRDTGPGIDETVKDRLFEPFVTTKPADRGTGLGLATVRDIARGGGGDVHVETQQTGTTFTVYWPSTRPGRAPTESPTPRPVPRRLHGGSETILLVEDDSEVRTVVSHLLVSHGYSVLEAANGFEALSIAARFEAPINLLIADVVMPHMSGPAMAARLVSRRPGLKVLYISGYPDERTRYFREAEDQGNYLPKPFSSAGLTEKVRNVIETRAS